MNKYTLLELLYAKNFRKTLKYMRKYEAYMRNRFTYDELLQMMEYDYKVFLEKEYKKKAIDFSSNNAIYELKEIDNICTNIESTEDAICKFKALELARQNILEE